MILSDVDALDLCSLVKRDEHPDSAYHAIADTLEHKIERLDWLKQLADAGDVAGVIAALRTEELNNRHREAVAR